MPDPYRSYMVRVRRSGVALDSVRIDVEDLLQGGRAQLTGGVASTLADGLAAAVHDAAADARNAPGPEGLQADRARGMHAKYRAPGS